MKRKARQKEEWPSPQKLREIPSFRQGSALTFYHPDYTVGPGVSPDHGECRPERIVSTVDQKPDPQVVRFLSARGHPSRALPPIGNWELVFPHPALKVIFTRGKFTVGWLGRQVQLHLVGA